MRLATLQFAPELGALDRNIQRANELLRNGRVLAAPVEDGAGAGTGTDKKVVKTGIESAGVDVLVLPEMAFTGYNFPSLSAIKPYLEPAGEGVSANWARETAKWLKCKVCVGYPEIERSGQEGEEEKYYNSLLVVDEKGHFVLNYRKSFLYYTDETWAAEGDVKRGFHELVFNNNTADEEGKKVATSFGICMDINPYKFEAPFTAWEFANRILDSQSQLVIVSMAWLTLMSREELDELAGQPDMDTFNYWIQRFVPLLQQRMQHSSGSGSGQKAKEKKEKEIVIVFANRAGEEEGADDEKPAVRYAGTSTIIAVTQRPTAVDDQDAFDVKIKCWDMKGSTEEGITFADTAADPESVFALVKKAED